ncbi:hypothetical protein [Tepidiforma sp.]|uniref:hypothetical protein n=1 Tax=Tepidiforma sp. TaxID=2682230 RepID=UPI002ADD6F83|nr:hypothetical protein [Tepidiforma sp.]
MAAAQTGKRYVVPGGVAEFIVTKGGNGELRCGDVPMQIRGQEDPSVTVDTTGMETVQLGKRYRDEPTGIEVLVVKPGPCALNVDGRPMELLQPKVLPSAD